MLYKSIVILGLKHSGKSTLGKRLAQNLGYDFFDTDELIEKNCKMSVRELYNLRGSEAFKYEEEKACLQIAEMFKTKKIVTATGGGICENPQAMMHLRSADVFVFLKNDLTLSAERILRKIGIDAKACFTGVPAFIKEKNHKRIRS